MSDQDFNLYRHFARPFLNRRDAVVLVDESGKSYSFGDLDDRSAQIANLLLAAGAQPGDRVSVQVQKSPENLALYFGCVRAGLVYQPLNLGYKKAELEYFVGNAAPAVAVYDGAGETAMASVAGSAGVGCQFTLNADGSGSLMSAADEVETVFETVPRERTDLAALLYSSGTTGVPKGIMLSHGNLLSNTRSLVEAWGFTSKDRLLHALPVFHVHGLFVAIGCVMLSGASMRWLPTFSAKQVVQHLPECTVLMGVPTFYTRLMAEPGFSAATCQRARLLVSGSAPLLEETFHAFEARTGHRILERYGMTETSMNTSNPLDGVRKPGTVGPPLPGVQVRVVASSGEPVPTDEVGFLQVKGPNVFQGYWKLPEKTAEDFTEDGFFNTGDMARMDRDGYVAIVGRNKDLVITGGLNVYPKEVERVIDALPGVNESAVIGLPHPDFGEGVAAVIVPADDATVSENQIIAACKESLANFKVPKKILFVSELPRNTMAKVQKNELRKHYADLFEPQQDTESTCTKKD